MKQLTKWTIIETDEWLFVVIQRETEWESYRCVKISDWWLDTLQYEEVLTEDIKWSIRE